MFTSHFTRFVRVVLIIAICITSKVQVQNTPDDSITLRCQTFSVIIERWLAGSVFLA